jgi:hypothetical protein
MRLGDLSIAEFSATDMRWWTELAQAVTSWQHGRKAGSADG